MNGNHPLSKSAALYERAKRVMPGGCSRNTIIRKPHPYYADHAEGCYITDIEGDKRIDFANNMASLIHGHSHPAIVEAVTKQMHKGTAFTIGTEAEVIYAEYLTSRSEGFEKIRFVNSGTEAVMAAIKASRAYTGRSKIAKVEGAYHGLYDYAEVSQTASPENWGDIRDPARVPVSHGTPQSALSDVVVFPYNNSELAISILNRNAKDIACVLIDLMPHRIGLVTAEQDFIEALYNWTRENSALLVFDEVITFRSEYGGLQDRYPITPDLTAMGKMIGGGFPVGAIAGRSDVLEVMNPLAANVLFPHAGTFSANPITMVAGHTAMKLYDREAVTNLNAMADYTRKLLNEAIKTADVPACVLGEGSMFRLHFKATPPTTYRESIPSQHETAMMKKFVDYMYGHGIIMINTGSGTLSTVMTKTEIECLAETALAGLQHIKLDMDV